MKPPAAAGEGVPQCFCCANPRAGQWGRDVWRGAEAAGPGGCGEEPEEPREGQRVRGCVKRSRGSRGRGPEPKPGRAGQRAATAPALPSVRGFKWRPRPPARRGRSAPSPPGNRRGLAPIGGAGERRVPIGCGRAAPRRGEAGEGVKRSRTRPPFCVGERGVVRSGASSEGGGRTVTAEQRGVGSRRAVCVSVLVGERSGQKSVRAGRCAKGRARPPPCCAPLWGRADGGSRLPSGVGERRREKVRRRRSSGRRERTAAGPGLVTLFGLLVSVQTRRKLEMEMGGSAGAEGGMGRGLLSLERSWTDPSASRLKSERSQEKTSHE